MKCLLVEDGHQIGLVLLRLFSDMGFQVKWATNGREGLDLALKDPYDLVVLDVLLPGKNGFDLCRQLRLKGRHMPVLFLSAMDELDDKVRGLELGADDYVCKPFEVRELRARVESLMRRAACGASVV